MSVYNNLIEKMVSAKISSPRLEARLLLAFVLGCEDSEVDVFNVNLSEEQSKKLENILKKRLEDRWPLDKIIGRKSFYKYDFIVNENVLSPRPDTEILLEESLKLCNYDELSVLDLGVGSGCILLSLLKEKKNAVGVGVDVSAEAIEVAKVNAKNLGIEKQVKFVQASWFDNNFIDLFDKKFDMIVTNPPYIPDKDIVSLETEVKKYDPMLALSGGSDGFDAYRRIAEITPFILKENGYILIEAGIDQAQEIAKIFIVQNLEFCKIVKDLSGIDRCVILKK